MVPWDLLRRGVCSLAASAEAFVFLQSEWTKALGSLCVANYLLGIGDRHLGNILVNKRTGERGKKRVGAGKGESERKRERERN